jgi:hypothetical protein
LYGPASPSTCSIQIEQVQTDAPQHGQILRAVLAPHAVAILVKADVQNSVATVLDLPVRLDLTAELRRIQHLGSDVVSSSRKVLYLSNVR